ncbi:aldehyde dehydrogenase family protein [Pseudonocardia sp. KRD-291]|nr:aldehyde dehydrogenase family protein [Pseudonocardia sp. KRD291]
MRIHEKLLIGGRPRASASGRTIEVRSPATGQIVGTVAEADTADVDAAVAAARTALASGPWARTTPQERAEILGRMGTLLRDRTDELADLISDEVGSPRGWAVGGQVGTALGVLHVHRALAASYPWVETRAALVGGEVRVRRLPVGVVGAIVPWNAPLFTAVLKLAPALLAGCTVLLKPSPLAPLSAVVLAEVAAEAGLPKGVLTVLPAGAQASEHLVSHPGVDKISFTGSTAVGTRIGELCARDQRRCTLELGGRSAALLLDDVELTDRVVDDLVDGAMANSGQICIAQTRFLVPRSRAKEITEALAARISALRVGDPADEETEIGPVIDDRAKQRIERIVADAEAAGARVAGRAGAPDLPAGHYVAPVLFTDVDPAVPVAREEIFGPVAVVLPYTDVDEAVRIANSTDYGLAGSVWSADPDRAELLAGRFAAGSVAVNSSAAMDLGSPFGGMRRSGTGRECGPEGVTAFVEQQSIVVPAAR